MRADARANREALVRAGRDLYARRGGPVPLSAVAQEAGVGIATLYRHFPTQADLITGILSSVRDQILQICDESLPQMRQSPETAWPAFAEQIVALQLGTFIPNIATALDTTDLPPEITQVRTQVFTAVAAVVDAARDAHLVERDARMEYVYLGLGVLSRPLPEQLTAAHPHLIDWLLHTFLRGLRP